MEYNVEDQDKIKREWEAYRKRSAVWTAVAVMLYILCVVPLIALSFFNDALAVVGLCLMFVMIAAATGILIWLHMSKPVSYTAAVPALPVEEGCDCEEEREEKDRTERNPAFRIINGVLWGVTICGYVVLSLYTRAWHITWLAFIIAIAVEQVIKAIFDLCSRD